MNFANKQLNTVKFAIDRYTYKNSELDQLGSEKMEEKYDGAMRDKILADPVTQRLIKRFKYMEEHGILAKYEI